MTRHLEWEKSDLLRTVHRGRPVSSGTDPDEVDAAAVRSTVDRVGRLFGPGRYFGLEVRGFERIPESPVLVVSNHSGGTIIPDVWGFVIAWYRHFGVDRPIHPLAHELMLSTPITGRYFGRRGVLRASRESAFDALSHGHDVLVMPGGDRDVWRPFRDRYRVCFAGHRGYARIAIAAGVPIVPVAHAGPHHTFLVLSDGRRVARAVGLHRIVRSDIWPLHLSLPWGLAWGPLPHLPLPVTFRYRIGEPIQPPVVADRPAEDAVQHLDTLVRQSVQGLLDGLRGQHVREGL